jgi:hypothetical protein
VKLPGLHSDLPTADPYLPGHGDPSWSATRYDIRLDYAVEGNRLRGQVTIDAVSMSQPDIHPTMRLASIFDQLYTAPAIGYLAANYMKHRATAIWPTNTIGHDHR